MGLPRLGPRPEPTGGPQSHPWRTKPAAPFEGFASPQRVANGECLKYNTRREPDSVRTLTLPRKFRESCDAPFCLASTKFISSLMQFAEVTYS